MKVILDERSAQFFLKNLHRIENSLSRALIYRAFYELVRDAKMTSEEYVRFILNQLESEKSDDLVRIQV